MTKPVKPQRAEYHHLNDGEWIRPVRRGFLDRCCDCSLTHRVDYRLVDGHIEFRAYRYERATAAARRAFKFEKD